MLIFFIFLHEIVGPRRFDGVLGFFNFFTVFLFLAPTGGSNPSKQTQPKINLT